MRSEPSTWVDPCQRKYSMPALPRLFETIPGNDTSGSVWGLPLGCVVGDPNSIVSDAPQEQNEDHQIPNFRFHETLRLLMAFLRGFRGAKRAHHRGREGIFTFLVWLCKRALVRDSSAERGELKLWVVNSKEVCLFWAANGYCLEVSAAVPRALL